jgi:hypothetical protein
VGSGVSSPDRHRPSSRPRLPSPLPLFRSLPLPSVSSFLHLSDQLGFLHASCSLFAFVALSSYSLARPFVFAPFLDPPLPRPSRRDHSSPPYKHSTPPRPIVHTLNVTVARPHQACLCPTVCALTRFRPGERWSGSSFSSPCSTQPSRVGRSSTAHRASSPWARTLAYVC